MICVCALSSLAEVCHRVISGDILVHELTTISHKESQMNKLCVAAEPSEQKGDERKSSHAVVVPPYDLVKMHLDMRLKELKYFNKYHDQLEYFLEHMCTAGAITGTFCCV